MVEDCNDVYNEREITDAEFEAIKSHCINPVDSRETGMDKPETLVTVFEERKM